MTIRRFTTGLTVSALLVCAAEAGAQIATPNAAGVAMGHVHFHVPDVKASEAFWTQLGAVVVRTEGTGHASGPDTVTLRVRDALVVLSRGSATGVSEGAVLNHVAFRLPSAGPIEAAGVAVQRLAGFPGVSSVHTPEGERVELFEDSATNLGFTPDRGPAEGVVNRHNQPVGAPIAFHHMHLYVPEGAVAEAQRWYAELFGGVTGKRSNYDAVDVPGLNVNISSRPRPMAPTRGRVLDHIGLEVSGLEAFCARARAKGLSFTEPYQKDTTGLGRAVLTDPWGTTIELTEGLRRF
jgi:catechol 2,3-dioxygenase-like lactoylglutathione lyase family enzyme